MYSKISGVILAGGANKRFNGVTKANILIDGKTIISRIIETIGEIFEEIIIVTNTPEEFKEHFNNKIVSDSFKKAGPLGGIHAALQSSKAEAVFVFAGDMPLVRKDYIIRQIDYFIASDFDVLIPRVKDNLEPLHGIYSCSIFNDLEKYLTEGQNYAVRDFFCHVNVGYIQFVENTESTNAFININTPSDISIVEKILGIC